MSKSNQFVHNTKAQADFGGVAIGAVLSLIVVGVLVFVGLSIFEGVTDSTALAEATTATTAYTASGVSVFDQIITIGSETYTVANTTTGAFYLTIGDNMTADLLSDTLLAEITANSTLVTAVDAGSDVVTITAVLSGTAGNYATTENMTNGAFSGLAMTGGAAADTFKSTSDTITSGVASSFALTTILMLVIIAAAIIGMLMVFASRVE